MRNRFKRHIEEKGYFQKNEKVLLAISGGVDSVVLFHLLREENVELHCAHVNFQLRGKESDGDENFVKDLCERYHIPLKILHANTKKYSKENKLSIQESARKIRYDWFEKLMLELNCSSIITAHHQDDSIETFFINLIRGTGLKGLTGIKKDNGKLKRPLLFVSKEEIEYFAEEENISFRQDASNFDDKYLRNNLRKNIIPQFKKVQGSFSNIMEENMNKLHVAQKILEEKEKDIFSAHVKIDGEKITISNAIIKEIGASHFLFVILSEHGFNHSHVENILANPAVGSTFYSEEKIVVIEREHFLIAPKSEKEIKQKEYQIQENLVIDHLPVKIYISSLDTEEVVIESNKNIAFLDRSKLHFPLQYRLWRDGDKFQPFGMKGKKLVSDFLREQKVSSSSKRDFWVLISGGEIAWLIGQRIGDNFRITEGTKNILRLELKNE